ncbi:MAG: T9SS type A sorting domain-containing protein [Candidatus Krumholzibacteriota bacterium]|nr:T9SS type A sorting domain-containing protein [Candidatus Krumholzibacteriota bacterium]
MRHALVPVLCLALVAPAVALDYVDSSPAGAGFPMWDGGDTELAFADVNGDGHVDFVTIGDHGSPGVGTDQHGIMVYFGDGAGGWSIHMEGDFGYGGIAVGDANGDGLMDVGYGMHHDYSATDLGDQLLEVALGDGTGLHWTPWDDGLATNGEDWGMMATDFADFDLDGRLDLAANSFGCCNGVHVYRNAGDGSWTQTWASAGGNASASLCTGDVNGDGAPDIAASAQAGAVWLGDGEGGFASADAGLPPAGGMGHYGVSLGDVDGDGRADLAFARSGGVFVYLWRADHWESASDGLPAAGDFEVTQLFDLDLDGCVDLAAFGGGNCAVWLGDGTGQWRSGGGFAAPPGIDTAAFCTGGDVDHNGLPDFVLVQEEGSWPTYQNRLYVYHESSTPAARRVAWQHPRGNEAFHASAVQTLRWSAAHIGGEPASIALELSTAGPDGPWVPLAAGLPDAGHWQWTVSGEPTEIAHLRVTLTQAGESVAAVSRAFRILPGGATPVAETPGAAGLTRLQLLANPVRERARFTLETPSGRVGGGRVAIYDVAGRRVAALVAQGNPEWDLRDENGRRVPAGIYLARIEGGASAATAGTRIVVLH